MTISKLSKNAKTIIRRITNFSPGTATIIGSSLTEMIETVSAIDHVVTKEGHHIVANAPTPTTVNDSAQKLPALVDRDHDPIPADVGAALQAPADTHRPTPLNVAVPTAIDKKRKVTIKKVF